MRILKLTLRPSGDWAAADSVVAYGSAADRAPLRVDLSDRPFTVVHSNQHHKLNATSDAIRHTLYGTPRSDGLFFSAEQPLLASVGVTAGNAEYTLQRPGDGPLRFTAADGAGPGEAKQLFPELERLAPSAADTLHAVDLHDEAGLNALLNPGFTREFRRAVHDLRAPTSVDRASLLHRRDALAKQIEELLAESRATSTDLTAAIEQIDHKLAELDQHAARLRDELHGLNTAAGWEKAEALRREIESRATVLTEADRKRIESEAAALDQQVVDCRSTVRQLETRQQELRRVVAETQPDGRADGPGGVFQQREAIASAERVLDALDAEVGQVAAAIESDKPIDRAAHAKLRPLAAMLREQLNGLCSLVVEQQRAQQRRDAVAEQRQLERALAELADRLELLLSQRESLVAPLNTRWTPRILPPEKRRGAYEATRSSEKHYPENLADEQHRLAAELCRVETGAEDLRIRKQELQDQRARLVTTARVDRLQAELADIENRLRTGVPAQEDQPPATLRASDLLAQLTAGELVQLRPAADGRAVSVIDRRGDRWDSSRITPQLRDQLFLAMQLAMVDACAARGIRLPVVLNAPFTRLDGQASAALAAVLGDFALRGNQVVVLTDSEQALGHCLASGAVLCRFNEPVQLPTPAPPVASSKLRVVREPRDGSDSYSAKTDCESSDPDDVFYLRLTSQMHAFPVLGDETGEAFSAAGITTVADLLDADPETLARRLDRPRITSTTVRLWQTHTRLLCTIPGVTLADAQVLAAAGFGPLRTLAGATVDSIRDSVDDVLATEEGSRFSRAAAYLTPDRLEAWIAAAQETVRRGAARPSNKPKQRARKTAKTAAASKPKPTVRKFYLSLDSDVEDGPSIGPKTAEKLAAVGVRTVADLLNADPASVADELDVSHIRAAQLVDWQHQARLVCRVPNLRGTGAQLLVACGFTKAEQIASAEPESFVRKIAAFCRSKPGERILRGSKAPAPERIAGWIKNAAAARSLEAA
ncbi:MAG: DUF4332 domain-containing protein [Planctomycetota bacterium]